MSTETSLWPTQSHSRGLPSATSQSEAARSPHESPSSRANASEIRSHQDMKLPGWLWLAELGRPHTVWLYPVPDNRMDVVNTEVGLAYRLNWELNEEEIALYDSPHTHYSEPLEICPIVDGQVQLTKVHALKGKGLNYKCPLGVVSGSMLQQLASRAYASESRSHEDVKLPTHLWMAELGRPDTVWVYSVRGNSVDVVNTGVGIAYRLNWELSEKEIALYDSPHTHYSEPLDICPIVKGRVQLTKVHALALKGKGLNYKCPLGIVSGSLIQQLANSKKDIALKKQE